MGRTFPITAGRSLLIATIAGIAVLSFGCSKDPEPDKVAPDKAAETSEEEAPNPERTAKSEGKKKQTGSRATGKATEKPDKQAPPDVPAATGPADMAAKPDIKVEQPTTVGNPVQVRTQEAVPPTVDRAAQPATSALPGAAASANSPEQPQPVAKQEPRPEQKPDPSRPPLPDPRLLLTMTDIAAIAPAKARFQRAPLAGAPRTDDSDAILYRPEKGNGFGFALQLFRSRNALETRKRFDSLLASYPSAQEIASVSGKTFFSYWGDTIHIGFVQPSRNLTAIVSCGRDFCDSDKLMELSLKIAERLR